MFEGITLVFVLFMTNKQGLHMEMWSLKVRNDVLLFHIDKPQYIPRNYAVSRNDTVENEVCMDTL